MRYRFMFVLKAGKVKQTIAEGSLRKQKQLVTLQPLTTHLPLMDFSLPKAINELISKKHVL